MKRLILIFSILSLGLTLLAQDEDYITEDNVANEEFSLKDKLFIDGNFALQFGNQTLIGGNPQIGYRLSDRIALGAGYSYYLSSFTFNGIRVRDQFHGPTAFTRVIITENLFARSDFQSLTYVIDTVTDAPPQSFNRNRLFLGGGYRAQISNRSFANMGVYLDVLDPVAQPLFRGGVAVGF